MTDHAALADNVSAELNPSDDTLPLAGYGTIEVIAADGRVKNAVTFCNIVTDVGDAYYAAKMVAAISPSLAAAPTAVSGMQVGSGVTAASKSGVGAAIGTFLAGQAFDATFPSTNNLGAGLGVEAVYKVTLAAGVGTGTVAEVAIVNTGTLGTAALAATTISRVVLGAAVVKGASDSLAITYRTKALG